MNLENRVNRSSSSNSTSSGVSKKSSATLGSLSRYGETPPLRQVKEGQILRGEITDLRNHEITITLEDNTVLHGKIYNGTTLAIGDTVSFKISSLQPFIALEALLPSALEVENSTVQKALELANLPKTEKNQSVVQELIRNNLPIHKQSIQNILHASYQFKNAQISTLVLMNRYHLPMTSENVEQFEAYRNAEHSLLNKVKELSDTLPSLLGDLASHSDPSAVKTFGAQLMQIFQPKSPPLTQPDTVAQEVTLFELPEEERTKLPALLQDVALTEEQMQRLEDGSMPIREAYHLLEQAIEKQVTDPASNVSTASTPQETVLQSLSDKYYDMQYQNNELGSLLNPKQRNNLVTALDEFSIPEPIKQQIALGDLPAHEAYAIIQKAISDASPAKVLALFQTEEFKLLFQNQMITNWTIQPKKLPQEGAIEDLYETIYKQSEMLKSFLSESLGESETGSSLSHQAGKMKQNIDFMQLLNQMFSYVQLPLKLKEQTAHADLYVYTKKQSLRQHPEQISVLLHLDMEQLGPLDVYISLNQKAVHTNFYLPDKASKFLFQDHIEDLVQALEGKGYSLFTEFSVRESNIDLVRDFINQDDGEQVKRYNFDIRA